MGESGPSPTVQAREYLLAIVTEEAYGILVQRILEMLTALYFRRSWWNRAYWLDAQNAALCLTPFPGAAPPALWQDD